jgi:hypothetical protein
MKERPIIFSGDSVRAILDDRKTQTRRLCKRAVFSDGTVAASVHPDGAATGWIAWSPFAVTAQDTLKRYPGDDGFPCPHGVVGGRLWVRETWGVGSRPDPRGGYNGIEYRADDGADLDKKADLPCYRDDEHDLTVYRLGWHSPIHMPRWASRIDLVITEVRVQRLQDITEEDARAEGCKSADHATGRECILSPELGSYRLHFQSLWDAINGNRATWDSNPWVWALSFRRINP